jgi:hypothetical protein
MLAKEVTRMNKEQRVERARTAATARWAGKTSADKRKQRLVMLEAQASNLGYRLVPVDDTEKEDER